MEEKLILCVSEFPELYNTTLKAYHDLGRKTIAWRNVSSQIGLPGL